MSGLTSSGFSKPSATEIADAIKAALYSELGAQLNLLPTGVLGQIVNIVADREDALWQAALDLYNGLDPDTASGVLLRYLLTLQGLTILSATKSTVTLTVNLDATTTLPIGRLVSTAAGVQFITTESVTSTTAGNYTVAAESVETGPIAASAGSLTNIDTPVAGWNSVTNAADATPGTNAETDAEARARRVTQLAAPGSTTPDAIRSTLDGQTSIAITKLLENDGDVTDGNGLPPHSWEAIVDETGTLSDDAIAQIIHDECKAAGIQTYGSDSGSATDSEGNIKTINFTRVTPINAYVEVDYTTDSDYPSDGDAQVKDAIAAYTPLPGVTVHDSKITSSDLYCRWDCGCN